METSSACSLSSLFFYSESPTAITSCPPTRSRTPPSFCCIPCFPSISYLLVLLSTSSSPSTTLSSPFLACSFSLLSAPRLFVVLLISCFDRGGQKAFRDTLSCSTAPCAQKTQSVPVNRDQHTLQHTHTHASTTPPLHTLTYYSHPSPTHTHTHTNTHTHCKWWMRHIN